MGPVTVPRLGHEPHPHGGTTRSWVVPRKNGHLCRIAAPATRVLPPDDAAPGNAPVVVETPMSGESRRPSTRTRRGGPSATVDPPKCGES